MSPPFRLVPGVPGPRQQSSTTCGSACATVARMLVDAPFARWITAGEGHPVPGAEGSTPARRFASWERTVQSRTSAWAPDRGQFLPWPPSLGTPPWGLRSELEHGGSRRGTRYRIVSLRAHSEEALRARYSRLLELVVDGEPAALYVGSATLPRHITLVVPGEEPHTLRVYEPTSGETTTLGEEGFATSRLGLGGWDRAWILLQPTGHRRVGGALPARSAWAPLLTPEPSPDLLREEGRSGPSVSPSSSA